MKIQLDTARQLIADHVAEVSSEEKSKQVQDQLSTQLGVSDTFGICHLTFTLCLQELKGMVEKLRLENESKNKEIQKLQHEKQGI